MEQRVTSAVGTPLEEARIQEFESGLRGRLLRPGGDGYDEARRVWNAMIDKRPALIARCAGVSDVISSVNFARTNDLLVSIKGGGHSVAGTAVWRGWADDRPIRNAERTSGPLGAQVAGRARLHLG